MCRIFKAHHSRPGWSRRFVVVKRGGVVAWWTNRANADAGGTPSYFFIGVRALPKNKEDAQEDDTHHVARLSLRRSLGVATNTMKHHKHMVSTVQL